jgi:hypothetical protein
MHLLVLIHGGTGILLGCLGFGFSRQRVYLFCLRITLKGYLCGGFSCNKVDYACVLCRKAMRTDKRTV